MTVEDNLFFYEHELEIDTRRECEERAIKKAFEDKDDSKESFTELKTRYYLQNLVEAYKLMLS